MGEPQYKETITVDLYSFKDEARQVKGAVMKGSGPAAGRYKMLLNDEGTSAQRLAAFLHEMLHIYRHDLDGPARDAAEIEAEAREQLREALEIIITGG